MAYIKETQIHKPSDFELEVHQRHFEGYWEDWKIIRLSEGFDINNLTPAEVIDLGNWLIDHGKRIAGEYDKEGNPIAE